MPSLQIRQAAQRGKAEHGWLSSRHTFSFANYYDPQQIGFSDLLVINDDRVQPSRGFETHSHRDMEIFSYVLEGALEHQDSMGTGSIIPHGDIQIMSAGTGIRHSEFNHSQEKRVHFLQIWIMPNKKNLTPKYQQTNIPESEKRGKLRLILSEDGRDNSLIVHQDTAVYAGLFNGQEQADYTIAENRFAYVHLARGEININGQTLSAGDGARIKESGTLHLSQGQDAEILIFDLRAHELPEF